MKNITFILFSALLFVLSGCEGIFYTIPNDTIIIKGDMCAINTFQEVDGVLKPYLSYNKAKEEYTVKGIYKGAINIQKEGIDTTFQVQAEIGKTTVFDVKKNSVEKTVYQNL